MKLVWSEMVRLEKGQTTSLPTINFTIILLPTPSAGYRAKKLFLFRQQLHFLFARSRFTQCDVIRHTVTSPLGKASSQFTVTQRRMPWVESLAICRSVHWDFQYSWKLNFMSLVSPLVAAEQPDALKGWREPLSADMSFIFSRHVDWPSSFPDFYADSLQKHLI